MATWTEEIVSAFQELGGISRYKELYSYFSSKNIKDYNAKKDGAAQIRGAIESHSRASEVFQKKSSNYKNNPSNDLFTPIGNLGDGFWGLNTSLTSDIKLDLTSVFSEGSQKKIYTTKYERNPKNRAIAIEVHGYNCAACDFNFSDVYGDLGDKFIEIHHIKPLHSLNEAVVIDPKLDLIPLCSNCHRMIHRNKNNVLSVNELKLLISRKD
ncbi:HNH endonuclease [Lactococcus lactis]|uniref:HNH endonuclease n=2 Tax=Lactococcus lactis TaxID=1358 RepID=UPI002FC5D5CE